MLTVTTHVSPYRLNIQVCVPWTYVHTGLCVYHGPLYIQVCVLAMDLCTYRFVCVPWTSVHTGLSVCHGSLYIQVGVCAMDLCTYRFVYYGPLYIKVCVYHGPLYIQVGLP